MYTVSFGCLTISILWVCVVCMGMSIANWVFVHFSKERLAMNTLRKFVCPCYDDRYVNVIGAVLAFAVWVMMDGRGLLGC